MTVNELEKFIRHRVDVFGNIPNHPSVYQLCQCIYRIEEAQYTGMNCCDGLPIQKVFKLHGGILCGQVARGFEYFYNIYRSWDNRESWGLGAIEVLGVIISTIEVGEAIEIRENVLDVLHSTLDLLVHVLLHDFDLYRFSRDNTTLEGQLPRSKTSSKEESLSMVSIDVSTHTE